MRTYIRIFEGSQLECSYVGDLLQCLFQLKMQIELLYHVHSKLPRKFPEENLVTLTLPKQMELGIFRIATEVSHLVLYKYLSNTLNLT